MLETLFSGLFDSEFTSVISVGDFLLCLIVTLLLGLLVSLSYNFGNKASQSFIVTLAILPMVVCVVIMLVSGNIGTAVVVAGALSFVRFRSAPATAKEVSLIFLCTAIGLACGSGYLGYGTLFTVVMCAVIIFYDKICYGSKASNRYKYLTITIPEDLDYTEVFDDIFEKYTKTCNLTRVKTTNMGSMFKLTYELTLLDSNKGKEMIDCLRQRNGNLEISLANQDSFVAEI